MGQAQGRVTLWMVEVFAAVAEARSVSLAARRLGASPSAVSQQISNLEAALGIALTDRAARPLCLTASGEVFLRRARNILDEAALARTELGARNLAHLTRFRLGMIEDFDADVTPRLLTEMAGRLQECRFLLETGASHRLLAQLEARELDIVVAAENGGAPADTERHRLLVEPFVAAVPLGPEGGPVARDLNGLAGLAPVLYTQRHVMGREIAAHLARQSIALSPRFEMDSYHAILSMVADGRGWTILPPLGLFRAPRFLTRVAVIPLPTAPLSRTIALSARRGEMGTLAAETAAQLRGILAEMVVAPARARLPWLGPQIAVLEDDPVAQVP